MKHSMKQSHPGLMLPKFLNCAFSFTTSHMDWCLESQPESLGKIGDGGSCGSDCFIHIKTTWCFSSHECFYGCWALKNSWFMDGSSPNQWNVIPQTASAKAHTEEVTLPLFQEIPWIFFRGKGSTNCGRVIISVSLCECIMTYIYTYYMIYDHRDTDISWPAILCSMI